MEKVQRADDQPGKINRMKETAAIPSNHGSAHASGAWGEGGQRTNTTETEDTSRLNNGGHTFFDITSTSTTLAEQQKTTNKHSIDPPCTPLRQQKQMRYKYGDNYSMVREGGGRESHKNNSVHMGKLTINLTLKTVLQPLHRYC